MILEWKGDQTFGQFFYSDQFKPFKGFKKSKRTILVSHEWITQITKKPSHHGCIAIIKRPHYPIASLLSANHVVVLDGIQDPGNLGTIIRSAVAFEVPIICLTNTCADPFHPKCVSATAGTVGKASLFLEEHWAKWLPQTEHEIYCLDPNAVQTVQQMKRPKKYVLVCGSEGLGIQSTVIKSVQSTLVSIPMSIEVESLNAGVSVSIALGHFFTNP